MVLEYSFKFDTILRHRCTVEFSYGRRLVVDYGVTLEHGVRVMVMHLMHLRHRHYPRRRATREPADRQQDNKKPEAPPTTAVRGFQRVESFHI